MWRRLAYRGGNWNNAANAGVFALNGNNARSNVNTNIGFRSALALFVRLLRLRARSNFKSKGRISRLDKPKIELSRRLAFIGLSHAALLGRVDFMSKQQSIIEKVYSWENLLEAYHEAARQKWFRDDVAAFSANLEENLITMQNELIWRTYEVGRYREFYVLEPKKRLIMALSFKDRVVQWAIYRQINPLLDSQMIFHSYGCRVGKGTTRAAERLHGWVRLVDRKPDEWRYLKLDIAKYFYRVDHSVLMELLRRKFPDEDGLLWLMRTIIDCGHTPFGLPAGKEPDDVPMSERLYDVGMPIGNLTSQLLANVCLDALDQYVKHELKARYYIRYMDDMIILHPDAKELRRYREDIETFLNSRLHLDLNSKTTIGKVKRGITFVGYIIFPTHRKLKPNSMKKMKSRMKYVAKQYAAGLMDLDEIKSTMASYYGMMKQFNSYGLRGWIYNNIVFRRHTPEFESENRTTKTILEKESE